MSIDDKKKRVEDIAEKFVRLDEEDKQYITGYLNGVQAERQKWEKRLQAAGVSA